MPSQVGDGQVHYLSDLRVLLTALVILHHTAITYGGAGQVFYHSPAHLPSSEPALVSFNAVNQTFFMALFFFVAGHLSRRSLARRMEKDGGVGGFLRDRIWRLGMPTVGYSLFGPMVCRLIVESGQRDWNGPSWSAVWDELSIVRGVRGPVWFCALLLIFDILQAACLRTLKLVRGLHQRQVALPVPETSAASSLHGHGHELLAALASLSIVDFFWRLAFPVGTIWTPLNLNLGYLLQYIAAYVFGILVTEPTAAVPGRATLLLLGTVSVTSGLFLASMMVERSQLESDPTLGGLSISATAYAVWNNFTGYLLGAGLLRFFDRYVKIPCEGLTNLAYPAFLMHIPVSTVLEVMFESWQAGAGTKTAVVGSLNVVASSALAWLWETISSVVWQMATKQPKAAAQKSRRRTLSRGQQTIEILEGLDKVGCH